MPTFFDTHTHLDDEQFESQREAVLSRATAAGVSTMIAVGTTADSSERSVALAERHSSVLAAVGIQPNYVAEVRPGDWERIVALASRPRVVAIGETGLDRYWDHAPFPLQETFFAQHIRLAQDEGLPFIVHLRDCGADMVAALRAAAESAPLRGVMHSFTGDAALAQQCLALGMHLSFAGMVTYKKSEDLRSVARLVPADRLLIETDSPYLSPHPHRGQRPNEPALVVHTAACLAEARGESLDELARQTTENAERLFRRIPASERRSHAASCD